MTDLRSALLRFFCLILETMSFRGLPGLMGAGAGLGASGLARLGGCLLPGWAPIPAKSPTPPPDGASWNHRLMLGDAPRLVDSAPWDAALLPAWLCRSSPLHLRGMLVCGLDCACAGSDRPLLASGSQLPAGLTAGLLARSPGGMLACSSGGLSSGWRACGGGLSAEEAGVRARAPSTLGDAVSAAAAQAVGASRGLRRESPARPLPTPLLPPGKCLS
mmetsp:Transcript_40264/g.103079  ORF Transcript_40264/g.103079 Transcript_40264/m.103079 type:complete len:218 (-) Transcript_40264:249-902(-)